MLLYNIGVWSLVDHRHEVYNITLHNKARWLRDTKTHIDKLDHFYRLTIDQATCIYINYILIQSSLL